MTEFTDLQPFDKSVVTIYGGTEDKRIALTERFLVHAIYQGDTVALVAPEDRVPHYWETWGVGVTKTDMLDLDEKNRPDLVVAMMPDCDNPYFIAWIANTFSQDGGRVLIVTDKPIDRRYVVHPFALDLDPFVGSTNERMAAARVGDMSTTFFMPLPLNSVAVAKAVLDTRARRALDDTDLGSSSPSDAFILGYKQGAR
ncbi:hypothetical protein [Bifidobacterium aquikefiricola]|uniref:Uncharacterized protein n=1 Tax=Bifidobacterium aquikefiricola TaxID=3059038 RepID=A0AB39U411_9BIFI